MTALTLKCEEDVHVDDDAQLHSDNACRSPDSAARRIRMGELERDGRTGTRAIHDSGPVHRRDEDHVPRRCTGRPHGRKTPPRLKIAQDDRPMLREAPCGPRTSVKWEETRRATGTAVGLSPSGLPSTTTG